MIHLKTFTSSHNFDDCLRNIDIPDDKIINVIPRGSRKSSGYDEYDTWSTYYVDVIYKD